MEHVILDHVMLQKLASVLHKQFANMKIERTTLLIWQHFVRVLDRQLHNYGNWFNTFLKIVEQVSLLPMATMIIVFLLFRPLSTLIAKYRSAHIKHGRVLSTIMP